MKIIFVVAVAENGVIGNDGDMPWRLSTDLKRFKELTLGKPMIMGRKTFDSIGKPLPGRTSIVVTRDKNWQWEGVIPVTTIDAALKLGEEIAKANGVEEICIIGGGEIFRQTMAVADTLHFTQVHAEPEGDTTFPEIDKKQWREASRQNIPSGEQDTADTAYIVYQRCA